MALNTVTCTVFAILYVTCYVSASTVNRVVGYLPVADPGSSIHCAPTPLTDVGTSLSMESVDYSALTHVNIAFLNPDPKTLKIAASSQIIAAAQYLTTKGVSVFISIGGGSCYADYWNNVTTTAAKQQAAATTICNIATKLGLHGIDVDLEGDLLGTATYAPFLQTLRKTATKAGLQLSAAVTQWSTSEYLTTTQLNVFDFLNVMVYDGKGPWDTTPPLSDFSTYSWAVSQLQYYKSLGIAANKLTLGLPFYGYDFTNPNAVPTVYWNYIAEHKSSSCLETDNCGKIYYNGMATIAAKTQLAQSYGTGIMIWNLLEDTANASTSLLRVIKTTLNAPSPAPTTNPTTSPTPSPAQAQAPWVCNSGYDFTGAGMTDISNTENKGVKTVLQCQALCYQVPGCNKLVWSQYLGGTCYFKNTNNQVVRANGAYATKACYQVQSNASTTCYANEDWYGVGDISNSPAPCNKCGNINHCNAWVSTDGQCYYKTVSGNPVATAVGQLTTACKIG